MHDAVRFASPAIFDTLVQLGSTQLNAMNPQGETPLHCAVQQGDGLMVGLLLANQADPLQASDTGRSALDLALQKVTNEYPAITTGTAKIAEKMIVAARQKNSVMDLDLLTIRFLGALVLKPAAFAYDGNDPRHLRQILLALGEKRTPGLLTGHEIFLHELNVQLRQAAACGGSESKSEARENIRFCQVYAAEIVNGALLQGQQQRAHGLGLAQR
ncbi:ankyrin repeat domain-containing protein [Paraburkholderia hayleyella]|uniref:ankyrin repeat domain-containing protein n=1 Tax=Paraburkholderia hayleyella TaxID=2152889 RepID=UPI00157FCE00|nr:ankyrin repeat domain-containing protein [Paraburkholderia hayleyella]